MNKKYKRSYPELSSAGIEASYPVKVFDEFGRTRETHITGERPLTLYIDKQLSLIHISEPTRPY